MSTPGRVPDKENGKPVPVRGLETSGEQPTRESPPAPSAPDSSSPPAPSVSETSPEEPSSTPQALGEQPPTGGPEIVEAFPVTTPAETPVETPPPKGTTKKPAPTPGLPSIPSEIDSETMKEYADGVLEAAEENLAEAEQEGSERTPGAQ